MSPGRLLAQRRENGSRNFVRNLWLGVLALNLLAIGFAAYTLYTSREGDEARARAETRNLSMTLEREIAGVFDNVDVALKGLGDYYVAMHRSKRFNVDEWNAALRRARSHLPILSAIRGVNEQGAIVHGLEMGDPQAATVTDRSYYAVHRDNPDAGLVISPPVFSRITQKWGLVLSRRLNDDRGRFSGIVAAAVPLERIGERFSSIAIGNNGVISMRDADMHLIIRLPQLHNARAEVGSVQIGKELADALQRDRDSGTYRNEGSMFDGVKRLHSYRRNHAYGFYVNVGMAEGEYLAGWYRDTTWVTSLILLFLLVTIVLARRLQLSWTAQEVASARLARSEADYRALAEGAPYGVVLLETSGAISYVNPAFTAMLGYTLHDIPDIDVWFEKAYPDPDYRKSIRDSWRQLVIDRETPGMADRIAEVCRSDGVKREIRSVVVKMRDGRFTITCEDITDRARAERALHESREQFAKLVQQSPLAMALVARDGTVEFINAKAVETYGYRLHEVPTMMMWGTRAFPDEAYRAEVASIWGRSVREARAKGEEIEKREYRITCRDGSVKTALVYGVWVGDKILVIFEDVTERKKVEEAMQLSHQVFATASEAIFLGDEHGVLTQANAEACRLSKYSREKLVGMHAVDLVVPEDIPRVAPMLARCDTGEVVTERYTLLCSDGSTVPLDAVVQRLQGGGYLCMARDRSEWERVHKQLSEALAAAESANAAKSRFLANASHDLRQPIQAMNLFCNALAGTALNEEQKQISGFLSLSARNLSDILNGLLDISKFDAGAVKPKFETVQCETFFRAIQSEFSHLAREKGLRFRIRCPGRGMAVLADFVLLHSLMANLVGNAIKYTERGGILMAVRRRRDQAMIQVWDSGMGIAPEYLDRIFEEYFQIGNPERDRTKGLGLGLAIVKNLAGVLETEVMCRSRPGKGSVFEFRLPLGEVSAGQGATPVARDEVAGVAAAGPNGCRVVVIDDDLAVAAAIQLTLEARGMQVSRYANAEDALASPAIADADFYITDLRLPGLNGREFLDAVQQRSQRPIRAVILTGDLSTERVALAHASQWPILFKPLDLPQLLAAIQPQQVSH